MLPLRQHVVNTVESNNRLDLRRYRGMGIRTIFAGERRLLACERNQRRKMSAGTVANHPDTLGIDAEFACFGTHVLHCRLGVVDRARNKSSHPASSAGTRLRTQRSRFWR